MTMIVVMVMIIVDGDGMLRNVVLPLPDVLHNVANISQDAATKVNKLSPPLLGDTVAVSLR